MARTTGLLGSRWVTKLIAQKGVLDKPQSQGGHSWRNRCETRCQTRRDTCRISPGNRARRGVASSHDSVGGARIAKSRVDGTGGRDVVTMAGSWAARGRGFVCVVSSRTGEQRRTGMICLLIWEKLICYDANIDTSRVLLYVRLYKSDSMFLTPLLHRGCHDMSPPEGGLWEGFSMKNARRYC